METLKSWMVKSDLGNYHLLIKTEGNMFFIENGFKVGSDFPYWMEIKEEEAQNIISKNDITLTDGFRSFINK